MCSVCLSIFFCIFVFLCLIVRTGGAHCTVCSVCVETGVAYFCVLFLVVFCVFVFVCLCI